MSANTVEASLPPAVGCYRRRAASSTWHHRRLCPFLRAVAVAATAASVAILDHPFISSAWCRASASLHPQARAQLLLQQLPPPSASTYCGTWSSSALVTSTVTASSLASLRPPQRRPSPSVFTSHQGMEFTPPNPPNHLPLLIPSPL